MKRKKIIIILTVVFLFLVVIFYKLYLEKVIIYKEILELQKQNIHFDMNFEMSYIKEDKQNNNVTNTKTVWTKKDNNYKETMYFEDPETFEYDKILFSTEYDSLTKKGVRKNYIDNRIEENDYKFDLEHDCKSFIFNRMATFAYLEEENRIGEFFRNFIKIKLEKGNDVYIVKYELITLIIDKETGLIKEKIQRDDKWYSHEYFDIKYI